MTGLRAPVWVRLLSWVVPARYRAEILGDLLDERTTRVTAGSSAHRAAGWLAVHLLQSAWTCRRQLARRTVPAMRWDRTALLSDGRLAIRTLRRQPALSVAVVLVLAGTIASNTALFSVVDGLLFRPLPFPDSDRLVHVQVQPDAARALSREDRGRLNESLGATPMFSQRANVESFLMFEEGAAAVDTWRLRPARVTPGFFPMLGVSPVRGRLPTADDARTPSVSGLYANAPVAMPEQPVVVISHELWEGLFGGDESVIGRTVDFPGTLFERRPLLAGVLPRGFAFPDGTNVWLPGIARPGSFTLARLSQTVSLDHVRAQFPGVSFTPLREHVRPGEGLAHVVLLAAAVLLQLVAWAQVASLLFARAAGRSQELSIRLAIGAGRWGLVRMFTAEALVISAVALICAWLLVGPLTTMAANMLPEALTRGQWIGPDVRAGTFAGLIALAGVLLLSLLPLRVVRQSSPGALLNSSARLFTPRATRTRAWLLVGQLAVTTTLLYMSGLAIRTYGELTSTDVGFAASRVIGFDLPPLSMAGGTADVRRQHEVGRRERVVETLMRLGHLPGVVAAVGPIPFSSGLLSRFGLRPVAVGAGQERMPARVDFVSADYARVMGLEITDGRVPVEGESSQDDRPVIVNEAFIRGLGVPVHVGEAVAAAGRRGRLAGVVRDFLMERPHAAPVPHALVVMAEPMADAPSIVMRLDSDAPALVAAIHAIVDDVWRGHAERRIVHVGQLRDATVVDYRARAAILAVIGLFAMPLALTGIAGATSAAVQQRTREIGVRIALGAAPHRIFGQVSREALMITCLGLVSGLASGIFAGRLMQTYLYGVSPVDTQTVCISSLLVIAIGWIASAWPAHRASRMDPAKLLRDG